MTGRARVFAQAAATTFISVSSAGIPTGLVLLSGSGVQSFGFQTQQAQIEEELRRASESPDAGKCRATMYDAIMAASKLFSSSESGDAIYLISNARDSSKSSFGAVREALIRQHTRLYVLLVTYNGMPRDDEYALTHKLVDLVDDSGGSLLQRCCPTILQRIRTGRLKNSRC